MELSSLPQSSLLPHNGKGEEMLRKQACHPLQKICSGNTHAFAEVTLDCMFIWEFAIQKELQCFFQLESEVDRAKVKYRSEMLLDFRQFIKYQGSNVNKSPKLVFFNLIGKTCQLSDKPFKAKGAAKY